MSLDELRERIKNELILHDGNIPDWRWNRTGLPAEAQELGVGDFLRLVEDVSRPLNPQFGKIQALRTTIQQVALNSGRQLSEVQAGGFALEAERLGLSRPFVIDQWIPSILTQLPADESPSTTVQASTPSPPPPASVEAAPPVSDAPDAAKTMQQKVRDSLDDYKEYVPAAAIRTLFRTIDYDENTLATTILTYLRENFYASVTEPAGATLRDKLVSTDWRHLIWWESKPSTPDVPITPPPTPTVEVGPTPAPAPSTGLRDMLVALLIAGGLIGFVVFLIKSGESGNTGESSTTNQIDTVARSERMQPVERTRRPKKKRRTGSSSVTTAETEPSPASSSDAARPYDAIRNAVGDYGERAAQKDGQWGLWRKGSWFIEPEYDEIDVFRNNRARVSRNGNSYEIDRYGRRIRD